MALEFLDMLVIMAFGLLLMGFGAFAFLRTGNRIIGSVVIVMGVGVFAMPAFL